MSRSVSGRRFRAASRRLLRLLAPFVLPVLVSAPARAEGYAGGPTVQDVVEFTRIVQPFNHDADTLRQQVSPDGRQAFIVTRRAQVARDVNRFEILLLDVAPERLAMPGRDARRDPPRAAWVLDAHDDGDDADPPLQDVRWAGNRTLVFRARVQGQPFQAYALDVGTRRLQQLTYDADGVTSFDLSADRRRVVYLAPVPNPPLKPGAHGVVVGNQSFWSVMFGQDDRRAQQRRYQYRLADGDRPARALGEPFAESSSRYPRPSVSPDGRWALLPRYVAERQPAWALRYPLVADAAARYGAGALQDPLQYYSRPYSYVARRLVAVRLDNGREQAVFDAPDDTLPGMSQLRADRLWRADGASVVIAGTHLPPPADGQPASPAPHVVEYWPDSGRWHAFAELKSRLVAAWPVAGRSDVVELLDGATRRRFARAPEGRWRELDAAAEAASGWTLRIDEALNQPPDVVAVAPDGRTARLTELNPRYQPVVWGTMRPYAWRDTKGRPWQGGLMTPAGHERGARHALVIQTYGFSPERFYLDGPNQFSGYTSGFAGRAFLREGLLVLAMPWAASSGAPDNEHEGIAAFADGVAGAVEQLVAEGLVDRERVGIIGWSATGERVLNLLTFSDAPVRAASILDGDANTLFSLTVTYAVKDGILRRKEQANQGGPFGEALPRWVRNDPSLHTDCVRAALRIESYGPLVQNNWDIYALLRRQYKPAEMIVIPGGAHALSRPAERLLSLQGNVDWFRFWLLGGERQEPVLPGETAADLQAQYTRWRQMADLKRADEARPRCEREGGGE